VKENEKPAVFLDRDGVIIVEKHFQVNPESIEFIPRATDGLLKLEGRFIKIIISNQSGVARGYFSSGDVINFNRVLNSNLNEIGINIDAWYFCPHGPDDSCSCRKPNPGMIQQAQKEHSIDLANSWVVGDKTSDIAAGSAMGLKTILVQTGYAGKEPDALDICPDYMAIDLFEAVNIILKRSD
jgi:D-glycero-D-manno-heptose 1,7-bisphosphate phosphatase